MNIVYFDTCIISGLAKQDIAEKEQDALLGILKKKKLGELEIVTSELARKELESIPKEYRQKHEVIYNLLIDVPTAKSFRRTRTLLSIRAAGLVRLVKELAQLKTLLKDQNDAAHIYQSFKNEVFDFITVDKNTILAKRQEIEKICGVKVMLPSNYEGK